MSMSAAKRKCFNRVTHCIFDNDGTLMDTESQYTEGVQNLLTPYGHTYTYELKMRCMGLPSHMSAKFLVDKLKLPITAKEFEMKFHAEIKRLTANVRLLPGVRDLLLHLHEFRIPMAVGTSALRSSFEHKARPHWELMPVFHHFVCGDDPEVKRGKPAPDIFLLAASRFHARPCPRCCLVFEDSIVGMRAALAAGMQVVMIPDPRVPKAKLRRATLVLRSMADFQPELFGLPAYGNCEKFTFG